MNTYRYVILGGGIVAGYAAQTLVEKGLRRDELCILSAETHLPYERPTLSKKFLAKKLPIADIFINPPDFYETSGIDVRLAAPVERVDFDNKHLYLRDDSIVYDQLLLATGAKPRRLILPGAELAGIYYVRQLEEANDIRQAAATAKQAVVIGGGFLGMEVAAVLRQMGVPTTLIFPEPHLCEKVFTMRIANFFATYYARHGVKIRSQEKVIGFVSDNERITQVSLASGTDLATDMVVVAIGVRPNVDLFANTALQIEGGIVVNSFLETNLPHIYAAGDVAYYRDPRYHKLRNVTHWKNAVLQGRCAAANMLGKRTEYGHIPYFFSDFFDLSYEFWGDTERAERMVYRGDIEGGSFSVWWLSPMGHLVAALVINRPEEERHLAPQWIQAGILLDPLRLSNAQEPLQYAAERGLA